MGIVYSLTDNTNGKQYISSTHRTIDECLQEHRDSVDNAITPISKAIKKNGWENFTYEVLFESLDYGQLLAREDEEITSRKTYGDNGYNKNPSSMVTFRTNDISRTLIRMVMDEERCSQTNAIKKLLEYGGTVWIQHFYKTQG